MQKRLTGGTDDALIGAWELFLVLYKAMGILIFEPTACNQYNISYKNIKNLKNCALYQE